MSENSAPPLSSGKLSIYYFYELANKNSIPKKLLLMKSTLKEDFLARGDRIIRITIAVAMNSAFLVLWAFIQYGAKWLIDMIEIDQVGDWLFLTFRWIFGISTFIPILLNIAGDTMAMYYKMLGRVRYYKEKSQEEEMELRDIKQEVANDESDGELIKRKA